MTIPKPPLLKLPCSAGGHKARLSNVTGHIKPHRHGGVKCPGSGQPPAPSRGRRYW